MMDSTILILVVAFFGGSLAASNYTSCPGGWISYSQEDPKTCLLLSGSNTDSLSAAHDKCVEMNASLMVIDTEKKYEFFKEHMTSLSSGMMEVIKLWVGLVKDDEGRIQWKLKDGYKPATHLPHVFNYHNWPDYSYSSGLIYSNGYMSKGVERYSRRKSARYMCEKHAGCKPRWFGKHCDKECHCHNEVCDPFATNVTCSYGCEIGWMNPDCTQRKQDADVRYFCANSDDQGKYVRISVYRKKVKYDNIQAVDDAGNWVSWCNNTEVHSNIAYINEDEDIMTIKINVDNSTEQEVKQGKCAGKITKGKYEWRLKLQQHDGLVSKNDQEVNIECDFKQGDDFLLSDETKITREKNFRKSGVRKNIEYLSEKKESVELSVIDASTGKGVDESSIGSPVVLTIKYGLIDDNKATGVFPYNCDASSPDGTHKARFIDTDGCPVGGDFPISAFHKNGTKSLITEPFALFGFDSTNKVEFHCSYRLCFENKPCEGCLPPISDDNTQFWPFPSGYP